MKKIKVKVINKFTDRYTGQTRKPGDEMTVTDARLREIRRSGDYVEVIKPTKAAEPKEKK